MNVTNLIRKALKLFPYITISQSCFLLDDGSFSPMEWNVHCVSYGWDDVAKLDKRGKSLAIVLKEVISIGEKNKRRGEK